MEDIIAIIMVFGIPLSAIFSFTYLKAKSMKMKSGTLDGSERKILIELQEENLELRSRLENLELIVSDSDLLKLKSFMEEENLRERSHRFKQNY
ncbi:hypothetical protein [Chondrinema litorale]|uniref:hypothetical protein n=1 Tax=Chondrinema litorale TaxID=2994555 RepID=UPI002542B40A|nr:hypothetical protein [Chondrinema litorale]UZR94783.1 hypothetical protein OQ292_03015 [Chondrinema litorale]